MNAAAPLLSVRNVTTAYGHIVALRGVDLDVHEREIVTLIGANGAGKSTLMMTIFGNPQAREGTITYEGRDITKMPSHLIARLGIAQSPEGRRIFPRMTVFENLQMGAALRDLSHFDEDLERICTLFPRIRERLHSEVALVDQVSLLTGRAAFMAEHGLLLALRPLSTGGVELKVEVTSAVLRDGAADLVEAMVADRPASLSAYRRWRSARAPARELTVVSLRAAPNFATPQVNAYGCLLERTA